MATSSIFKNFVISDPEEIEAFANLFDSEPVPIKSNCSLLTDKEELRKLFGMLKNGVERLEAEGKANEGSANGKE